MNDELQQVELSIEAAKETIALKRSLDALIKNKHFRHVIDTGYLEKEATRLVHLKADFNMASPENQAYIIRCIDSIGSLRSYFSKILQQGNAAEAALQEHEQTHEVLLEEELQTNSSRMQ